MIKRFEFEEDNRARLDLSGGLRLNPGTASEGYSRVELPRQAAPNDELYDTSADLHVISWVTNPLSVREWRNFEVIVDHATDPDGGGAVVTSARYRLTDGTDQFYWDGASWVVNTVDWNTEADVANNIGNFPISSRSLGVVVNLVTTDERVTPQLRTVKVLYGASIDHFDDYIYRSLIPSLRESLRPIGRMLASHTAGSATVDLTSALPELPYNIVGLDAVFDRTNDPDLLVDILDSYDTNTNIATLTADPGSVDLMVHFVYEPEVAESTSRDYSEVRKVPQVIIEDTRIINATEREQHDHVINRDTNAGTRVLGPKQGDIEMLIRVESGSGYDQKRLADGVSRYFATNKKLTAVGIDQEFDMVLIRDFDAQFVPNKNDIHAGRLRARILGAVFFERGSTPVTGVTGFSIGGPPVVSVP